MLQAGSLEADIIYIYIYIYDARSNNYHSFEDVKLKEDTQNCVQRPSLL